MFLWCQKEKTRESIRGFFVGRESSGALVAGQLFVLDPEHVFALDIARVLRDAINRADLDALRFIVMADAFGAFVRVDHIDFLTL